MLTTCLLTFAWRNSSLLLIPPLLSCLSSANIFAIPSKVSGVCLPLLSPNFCIPSRNCFIASCCCLCISSIKSMASDAAAVFEAFYSLKRFGYFFSILTCCSLILRSVFSLISWGVGVDGNFIRWLWLICVIAS